MCEAYSLIRGSVRGSGESLDRTFSVIRMTLSTLSTSDSVDSDLFES
jgi:hypothetical protein